MIPSFFVELESIPLTSNGKIDRKSLPQVGHSDIITQEYTAPQTQEEHLLVGIWEDVLKLDKISIHDNFFDLGGNSLIVAQVINRIEKQLGSSVSFRDFFTSPTISELCGKLVKTGMDESIPVIAKNSSYEVSPSQRRLWVLSQLEGGSKAYNMPVTVRFRGVLDTKKFKSSFELLLARHEILRTYFKLDGEGHLQQYITDSIELGSFWEEYHSSNESDSSEIISRISSHVFDLSSPYLFRLGLIKEDDSSYLFTFTIHHILSDGWSLSVLINDLISIYNSLVSGEESGLSPLSIQYKDYADWLNKKLSNNNIDSRSFWHSHLEGELPVLQLPAFKKRPSVQTYNGSNSFYVFPSSFLESLEDFGKSRQSTLFMILMTGVKALLHRYSGQDDIIVGSPIAGRDHAELENQIGLYINTMALRTRYESENSFESLLLQERDTLLKAYQYQDYPFDRLIDELSVKRDISRSPLFDVMVVLQNQQQVVSLDGGGSFNGFEVEEYAMEGNTAQFDLSFNFSQHPEGLSLNINYNTDIYEHSFINTIFIHLEKLLTEAISSPDSAIERLDYLSEEEEQTVLSDFNKTACDYDTEKTLIDLFEKQVRLTPNQPAIIYEGFSLSYREADEEANRLSHYILDTVSVKPDDLIAVKLERSTDLIVTLLAILKSGCAYVPIDPSYPLERIEYIEKNSGSLLTIDEDFWNRFKAKRDLIPTTSIPRIISPDNLAYVIYTSGTTGNPKGVMIEHRNVVNLMYSFSSGSQENCRTSLTCNYSFDATIIEIFDSLVSGSSLYIPSRDTVSIPSKYALYIIDNHITHCYIHPMFIEEISTLLKERNYTGLKKIFIGVEPIRYKTVNYFLDNGVHVVNAYGPTEITVCCTLMKVEQGNPDEIIPIGKPIDNTQLYILDTYHHPVGVGMTGELYIAGAGLARGYLNNAALTEEKFIPNPFSEEPGSRMYHTGDLGRWLPDGNIEFLGRKDHQVKIRGFRIELGEIENTLLSYGDSVTGCVVDVRGTDNDKQIVAYYVCSEGVSIDKTELRSHIQSKLPEYMVPSFFVELERIPLTSNGKIDRKSLPQVGHSDIITKEYTAPQTPEEHLLVGIWEDVLKLDKISIYDNFFDLGGNSLIVAQVINRIEKQLGSSVSFRDFFTSPTISELCSKLVKSTMDESIPVIAKNSSYEVSPSQRRLWVLSQLEGGSRAYNMPVTVRLRGVLDTEKFKSSFELLLARHEILRTYFKLDAEGSLHQYITDSIELGSFWEEYNSANESDSSEIISQISSHVFDLSSPYLFRLGLIKEDDSSYLFTFTIHHILSDGWSLSVLINDLIRIYNSLVSGEESGLSPLSIQYKDYADWLNKKLSNNNIDSRSFWHSHLEGELPVLQLPAFKKRPVVQTYNGSDLSYVFSGSFLGSLEDFGKSRQSTLFMVLMAGVKALLRRYSGQDDIIVGSPIAGRDHAELENQIGLYLNTLALRTRYDSENSFESLLLQERDTLLKAYQYQDYPFDRLIDELSVKRDISRSPLFDVMVVLQNQQQVVSLDGGGSFNGFEVEEYAMEGNTAQFDLSFNFSQHPEGLSLNINYNTDIYERSFINTIFIHLEKLLTEAISSPDSAIERLDYLSEEEEQTVLSDFNRTACDYERDKTIIDLFEEQCALTPDSIAVIYEDQKLSYKELNERSNRLSHYILDTVSVEPEDLIAVKLERSSDLIVTLLAILKSGCAYVPIDPSYPSERIAYIENNSGSKLTIDAKFLEGFENAIAVHSANNPERNTSSNHLAYVIYTSGTTGNPKGVMIEHGNALQLVSWAKKEFKDTDFDIVYAGTSFCFDLSVYEMFYPLSIGKSIRVLKNALEGLLYMNTDKNILLNTVPSVLETVHEQLFDNDNIKAINLAGEPLSVHLVERINEKVELRNLYGPSEDTTYSTCSLISGRKHSMISIGKPISNTEVYILDAYHRPVGVGMTGDLYISGLGLSRGYLNNTALTDEKFLPNPFSEEPGSRMYHTGDLARWLPDGNIEFLGRKDHQVKIRGFRIELGEIETTILGYGDSVTGCVVDVRGTDNEKQLVAYYVCSEGMDIDKSKLRAYLHGKLPEYMVPSFFVELESIPLTPNGKIDRKALPQVGHSDIATKEYTAPVTQEEHLLVGIWEDVLKLDRIGIHDNFFELGGNSISLVSIWNKMQKLAGTQISYHEFFRKPTIYDVLNTKNAALTQEDVDTKQDKTIYFIPPVIGFSLIFNELISIVHSDFNCYSFDYKGILENEPAFASVNEASEYFSGKIVERTKDCNQKIIILGYSMGGNIGFEITKILEKKYKNIELILLDSYVKDSVVHNENEFKSIENYLKTNDIEISSDIENLVLNNLRIFAEYVQRGEITSKVTLLKSASNTQNMDMWRKYTTGELLVKDISGSHWEALSSSNLKLITNVLYEKQN